MPQTRRKARALKDHLTPKKSMAVPNSPPAANVPKTAVPMKCERSASRATTPTEDDRAVTLEKQLEKAFRRIDARGKEAESLRKRVQELEPEVRRLERLVGKLRESRLAERSPSRGRSQSPGGGAGLQAKNLRKDVDTLKKRAEAAEQRASALEDRCEQLERNNAFLKEAMDANREKIINQDDESASTQPHLVERQLAVAERKVQNSLYISEAHEGLAAQAVARERAAEIRATEYGRRLQRALEKLEATERRDRLVHLEEACKKDADSIHAAESEIRSYHLDPDLHLPVSTAQRRGLARAEQRLCRLRKRLKSQTATLNHTRSLEKLHEDLRTAASAGDCASTSRLLASGISVNVPDKSGFSAFLYSCGQSNPELVRMMLAAGGDAQDGDGKITALHVAARNGNVGVIKELLRGGAPLSARDSVGGTPLHTMAAYNHEAALRTLLEAGADVNLLDEGANTPLHILASRQQQHHHHHHHHHQGGLAGATTVAKIGATSVGTLLLEWGASPTVKNSEGLTPLAVALRARNQGVVLAYRGFFGDEGEGGSSSTMHGSRGGDDHVATKAVAVVGGMQGGPQKAPVQDSWIERTHGQQLPPISHTVTASAPTPPHVTSTVDLAADGPVPQPGVEATSPMVDNGDARLEPEPAQYEQPGDGNSASESDPRLSVGEGGDNSYDVEGAQDCNLPLLASDHSDKNQDVNGDGEEFFRGGEPVRGEGDVLEVGEEKRGEGGDRGIDH